MQSIRLVASERKVLIMQSGIRQSVEFTSQDTALLKGDWKLESTCEVALVCVLSSYRKSLPFRLSSLAPMRREILAACNGKPREIMVRVSNYLKVKPEKLDRSRILWPQLSPRLAFLLYSPSRGRYSNHLKLPFRRCSYIELECERIIMWIIFLHYMSE